MGLNLNINHVFLHLLEKFDGRYNRNLSIQMKLVKLLVEQEDIKIMEHLVILKKQAI